MKAFDRILSVLILGSLLTATASKALGQTDHEKHHPQVTDSVASIRQIQKDTESMPGSMGGMEEMMSNMGKPPQKELYPSMMQVPDMARQTHNEIKRLADERVKQGNALLASGMESLKTAMAHNDGTAIREANLLIRQGHEMLESGLAAQQALASNQNISSVGLQWFRQNMNLTPVAADEQPHGFFGLSWFHYVSMMTLTAFVALVIWMYFHKMKRANALVARLAGNQSDRSLLPVSSPLPAASVAAAAQPVAAVNPDIAPTKSNTWSGTLYVAAIFDETPTVKTFRLVDPASGKLPFTYLPGQFITVTVIVKGVPVKRSYTIASSPTLRDCCEITVKHEEHGAVSHYLHTQVHEGSLLQLTGPSGKFTFTGAEADSVVLIGGGVGVTPMMSVIRYLTDRSWKGDIFFFFSCRDEANIIFKEEIFYLQKRFPNLQVCIVLNNPPAVANESMITGYLTKDVLTARVPDPISRRFHLCGPPPMMDAVKSILAALPVPKEQVITEVFTGKLPIPKPIAPKGTELGEAVTGKEPATGVVTFVKSNKTAMLTPDKTILEASEEVGVNIEYSCRVGTCGICKTKLLSGKVRMDVDEALTEEDKANNIILACQARAGQDVSIDA